MRYVVTINQKQCIQSKVSLSEGALMDLLNQLGSWADDEIISGKTYYFLSRSKVIEELPFFFKKLDTVYRNFKSLESKKFIEYQIKNKRDYVRLTPLGKRWNSTSKNSDFNPPTDFNPPKLGFQSVKHKEVNLLKNSGDRPLCSDSNPTDKYDKYTSDNSLTDLLQKIDQENPLVFSSILENKEFHNRLKTTLQSKNKSVDLQKDVLPILSHWLCTNWTANGLSSSTGNLRSKATSFVIAVVESGGLISKKKKYIGKENEQSISQIVGERLV